MESTVKIKLDFSGMDKVLQGCKILKESVVRSGVLNGDPETLQKANINELGGVTKYEDGPYKGEEVRVPPRSFVKAPARHRAPEAIKKAIKVLENGINQANSKIALEIIGQEIEDAQIKALERNGEGANPDWLKHNDPRTVATKGFDRPLWSRRGSTFPIEHEVVRK